MRIEGRIKGLPRRDGIAGQAIGPGRLPTGRRALASTGWETIPADEPPLRRIGILVLLAPLLGVTVLAGLPFAPDLVMLLAVLAGLAYGPVPGAVTGFAAGLAADLMPPALPPAGRTALVLCLAGYACGLLTKLPVAARLPAGVVIGALALVAPTLAVGPWWPAPDPSPQAALPYSLLAAPVMWVLLTRRRRDPLRIAHMRTTDATSVSFPTAAGARDGGRPLSHLARPPLAGAGNGRPPLRPRRRRGPRAPHRRPSRPRAHR